MTIVEAAAALRRGEIRSVGLVREAQRRIAETQDSLNAFITTLGEPALERARRLDAERDAGRDRGPLHGVPIAVKDNFLTTGVRTTNGSRLFAGFVPDANAAAVERLEAAGAVIVGKTNMHELAYGITSTNPHHGAVRNPHDPARIPGGSSGGSGAAVAAGVVPAALGSDTGGSIRIPASYCGCVGLKPTYGVVDRRGCLPLGLTLDHVGPLTTTVEDARIMLEALTGRTYSFNGRIRYGIAANFFFDRCDAEIAGAVRQAAASVNAEPVVLPDIEALNTAARVILLCEASAIYERYADRRADFGPDVLALVDQGRLIPATDYVNAQRVRKAFIREFQQVFRGIDCLITPATPIVAPRIGETEVEVAGERLDVRLASTRLVRSINALGLPAISVPCRRSSAGLPIGMQLVARHGDDALLLSAAAAIAT